METKGGILHTPVRLALAVLVAACALVGCGRQDAEQRRGGTAVIGGYVELRSLNPFSSLTDLNKALERYALYTPLVMLDSALVPQPWLAEGWDTTAVGRDSLLLTFRLRRDVRWHDGTATTGRDVVATFRYAADPRTAWVDAAALAMFAPEPELLDDYTVRFRLRRHPDFLEAFFLLPPLPSHLFDGTPPEELGRHPFGTNPVGNGPFRFLRRSPQEWVFEANPDFPEALGGAPALERLVYRTVPEQTSLVTEVLTGRVDLALSIRPPQLAQLRGADDVRIITFAVPNWVFLAMNTRLDRFADRDVRRAIGMAIDRQALVDGIMGGVNVTGRATVTPVHWAFDSDARMLTDTDSARLLLERAGWVDRNGDGIRQDAQGRPFRFRLKVWSGAGSYRDLAEAVQAQLGRVGIAVQPEVVEFNTFVADVQGRNFEAAIGNWTDNLLRKDDSQLLHSRNADSPRQWTGFNSPRLDFLLDTLAVTMERESAREFWREYQQAVVEEAPLLVLFYARGINAARSRLQGLPEADPRGPMASVQRWRVPLTRSDTAATTARAAPPRPAGG